MNRAFIYKIIGIFMLTLLMAWAVSYINTLILERQQRNNAVKQDIANSSAAEQTIIGPILVIPYIEEYTVFTTQNNYTVAVKKRDELRHFILPDNLELDGGFSNQIKSLGIYKALMYQLGGSFKGSFKLPANLNIKAQHEDGVITLLPAYVSIGISDPRGISGKPEFIWNGQSLDFAQGSQITSIGNGIHVAIGALDKLTEKTIPFNFKLNLHGMENFNFVPIAENNTVALRSSWRHPHFSGSFLPDQDTQSISAAGFSAHWAVSSLSSSNQAVLIGNLASPAKNLNLESLRIGFVEPINVYSQADRATKYGFLFIGLTFAGFFIFEILKHLRIHPAQYTLVGLAMALFYLLLISLSEHLSFAMSYSIASLACISLLAYYLTYVLGGKRHGFIFATLLTSLYGALYTILASEDNALLMGSLLVFGLLVITMVVTRKVDWYQISTKSDE